MIQIRLKQLLDEHGITAYRLVKATNGHVATNTVYSLASGKAKDVKLSTLENILTALRTLTGKPMVVSDLLEYQEPASTERLLEPIAP
jgi:DNA-binding Xre family transcriptional regulator